MKLWLKIVLGLSVVIVIAGGVFLLGYLKPAPEIENIETPAAGGNETLSTTGNAVQNNGVATNDGTKNDSTKQKDSSTKNQTGGQAGMQGPYFHSLYFGTATNLNNWTLEGAPFIEHASVPDLILLSKAVGSLSAGTLVTYFVDAHSGSSAEQVGMLSSTDSGKNWSELIDITVSGMTGDMKPVDPSIVQLDGGRLRLYFYDISGVAAGGTGPHYIYSAVSSDGINFAFEKEVFKSNSSITDPEVVYFNNQWLMYYAIGQNVGLAVSTDGLSFTDQGRINNVRSIPGAIITNGQLNIFGCSDPVSYVTSSDGQKFGSPSETTGIGEADSEDFYCDPAPVQLANGSFIMVIKKEER